MVPAPIPAEEEAFATPGVVRRGDPETLREAAHRVLRGPGQSIEEGWRPLPTSCPASVLGGRLQSLSSGDECDEDTN